MTEQDVLKLFKENEGYLEGHFLLSSGLHSAGYMQCALVLQNPKHSAALGQALAEKFAQFEPQAVIGPAMGGIIIAHEVARALGVNCLFTERVDGQMTLRRGFHLPPGARVVVVEDVVTTGGSAKEVALMLKAEGIDVLSVGSVIDRSLGKADFEGLPFASLAQVDVGTYEPESCPLCAQGVPLVKPGSRSSSVA